MTNSQATGETLDPPPVANGHTEQVHATQAESPSEFVPNQAVQTSFEQPVINAINANGHDAPFIEAAVPEPDAVLLHSVQAAATMPDEPVEAAFPSQPLQAAATMPDEPVEAAFPSQPLQAAATVSDEPVEAAFPSQPLQAATSTIVHDEPVEAVQANGSLHLEAEVEQVRAEYEALSSTKGPVVVLAIPLLYQHSQLCLAMNHDVLLSHEYGSRQSMQETLSFRTPRRRGPSTPLPRLTLKARLMRSQEGSASPTSAAGGPSSELPLAWPELQDKQTWFQDSLASDFWSVEDQRKDSLESQSLRQTWQEIRHRLGPPPCHNCVALVYDRHQERLSVKASEELPMQLKPKVHHLLSELQSFQFPRKRDIQHYSREVPVKVHVVDQRKWGDWGLSPARLMGAAQQIGHLQGRIEELETDVANAKTFELQHTEKMERTMLALMEQRKATEQAEAQVEVLRQEVLSTEQRAKAKASQDSDAALGQVREEMEKELEHLLKQKDDQLRALENKFSSTERSRQSSMRRHEWRLHGTSTVEWDRHASFVHRW
eukprot:symbB.v1.2.004233.t1/scaffold221.1/size262466/17